MGNLAIRRSLLVLALVVLSAVVLAACGGSGSSSSSSVSSSSGESSSGSSRLTVAETEAGGAESSSEIVPAPPTEPPTETPITEPLNEKPPHQEVVWLACALPACQGDLSAGYKNSAAAIGWGFEQINYETLKASEGVQQALNKNPDSIFITGIPTAAFEPQAKEAIKREIPIFSGFDTTEPEPKTNGLYAQYANGPGFGINGEAGAIAAWMINDSGGKAKTVMVTIPEYPILSAEVEAIETEYAEKCPECTAEALPVTVEDVGEGKVTSKLVAYLQSHPETNYVEFTFSDLSTGAYPALQAAGLLDKVKMTGVQANPAVVKEISEGKQAAWAAQAQEFGGWMAMDSAARIAQGMPLTAYEKSGKLPTWIIDSKEQADKLLDGNGEWAGPEGFQEKFEELWHVK